MSAWPEGAERNDANRRLLFIENDAGSDGFTLNAAAAPICSTTAPVVADMTFGAGATFVHCAAASVGAIVVNAGSDDEGGDSVVVFGADEFVGQPEVGVPASVAVTLNGGIGEDNLTGGDGNDSSSGAAGNDVVDGGAGDDWLAGGDGADDLTGGDGFDTAGGWTMGPMLQGVSVSFDGLANDGADANGDRTSGEEADNVRSSVEKVMGTSGNDTMIGDAGAQTFDGLGGVDTLRGGAGDDVIWGLTTNSTTSYTVVMGEGGNDTLYSRGRVKLYGGTGNDRLEARNGYADIVACEGGTDTAVADRGPTVYETVTGCETVT